MIAIPPIPRAVDRLLIDRFLSIVRQEEDTMVLNKLNFVQRILYPLLIVLSLFVFVLPKLAQAQPCTGYSVILIDFGSNKIQVIKAIRKLTGLDLRDAKEMVEQAPVIVNANLSKVSAFNYLQPLQEAGGSALYACDTGTRLRPAPPPAPIDTKPPRVDIETDTILVKTVGDRIKVRGVAEDNNKVASIIIYAEGRAVKTCAAWECWYGENVNQPGPRKYRAEALDPAGNRGISKTLEFMVHPSSKPGPSLNIRTDPYNPTSKDRVRFIASASHSSGVRDISIHVNGRKMRTCQATKCEYTGGPYKARTVAWRVSARSKDGGETYGSENRLQVKAAPISGQCSISGRAVGSHAAVAPAFFINLYGPNNDRHYRETKSFQSNGRYQFTKLPAGRYLLNVDTRGDTAVGAHPRSRTVECQGAGPKNVNFEFR